MVKFMVSNRKEKKACRAHHRGERSVDLGQLTLNTVKTSKG